VAQVPAGSGESARPESASDDADTAHDQQVSPDERLADALERVAHGATVSVPSILLQRGLAVAFTTVLTNGFSAAAYGQFALARRIQRFLRWLALGFRSGISRFVPATETVEERNAIVTVAAVLLVGMATVFGALLFVAAPFVTRVTGVGGQFQTFLQVFGLGLPVGAWLFTAGEVFRGLEEVGPLNLTLRLGFPGLQLLVGVVLTVVVGDLVAVAAGVVASMGAVALVGTIWLVRERDLRPRFSYGDGRSPWRRYLRFTLPLFVAGFATTTQRLGFYPLIALLLSGVAGGIFAVGVLIGTLVRLPLMGINQFIQPVAAALHEEDHREALRRLYHVTGRLVLVGVTALAVPVIVYREAIMSLFGPTFAANAGLLPAFVLAQYGACAAGSVGILLTMTDNQRALLVVNVVVTLFVVATTVPLTLAFGLPGVVAGYLLMLTVNNGLEVAVLYYLEGLQPFTRRHARPLIAAVPLAGIGVAVREVGSAPLAPIVGTLAGLVAYTLVIRALGFTPVERRLGATLRERYRDALRWTE
jgi:O-antigen/teichoic acid export membrane protein